MKKIVDGIHRFQNDVFTSKQNLFKELTKGQNPLALFITCSDSRIDPNLITQTEPGELFLIRNAGNIIPPYGQVEGGEAATIEYAVKVLGVTDIIICGHSNCGAMGGLLNPDGLNELPAVRSLLTHAETVLQIIGENCSHITDPAERLKKTVEANVLVQMKNLKTHPSVKEALSNGDLEIHGWVYEFETGEIFNFQKEEGLFTSL
jgi:carbonic anhydrase